LQKVICNNYFLYIALFVSITVKSIAHYRQKHCTLPSKALHITVKSIAHYYLTI